MQDSKISGALAAALPVCCMMNDCTSTCGHSENDAIGILLAVFSWRILAAGVTRIPAVLPSCRAKKKMGNVPQGVPMLCEKETSFWYLGEHEGISVEINYSDHAFLGFICYACFEWGMKG